MTCVLAVTWLARPGEEELIRQILRTMVEATNQEPGCVQYEANCSVEDPLRFFLYEVYLDEAALEEHQRSEHFQRNVVKEALPLLQSRERLLYRPL
jgi:quinol monooxygenase YgiN